MIPVNHWAWKKNGRIIDAPDRPINQARDFVFTFSNVSRRNMLMLFGHDAAFSHDAIQIIQFFSQIFYLLGGSLHGHGDHPGAMLDASPGNIDSKTSDNDMASLAQDAIDIRSMGLAIFDYDGYSR